MNQEALDNTYAPIRGWIALVLSASFFLFAILAEFYVSPFLALAIGLAGVLASYFTLERSLLFFLIGTLLWPYTMGWNVGPLQWGPSRTLFVLMIFVWILALVRGTVTLHRTPLDLALLLFVTVMIISSMISAPHELSDQVNGALKTLGYTTVEWILLFYLVSTIPSKWQQVRKYMMYISVIVSIVALVGILEFLTGIRFYEWLRPMIPGGENMKSNIHEAGLQLGLSSLVRGGISRIVSTTISFQEVGTLMAMAVPLILYFLAYSLTLKQNFYWLVSLAMVIGALFLSVTRGAFLATAVAVLIMSILSKKYLLRCSIVFMIPVILVTFLAFPNLFFADESVSAPGINEITIKSRLKTWQEGASFEAGN